MIFHKECDKLCDVMIGMLPFHVVVVVVGNPTPSRDGGMAEDHGAPEAGKLSRVWTRGRTETESRQRVSGAKSP